MSTAHRQTATAMSASGHHGSSPWARPTMPTPKVGRATSISSRAAETVRATTMKGAESRRPGYRRPARPPLRFSRRSGGEELRGLVGGEERAVAAARGMGGVPSTRAAGAAIGCVEGLAGEVVVEQAADLGQAAAAAGPGPAVGADLDRRAGAGVDGRPDLAVRDPLAVTDPHRRPHPPFAVASL